MKLITNRLQIKSKTSAYTVVTSDDVILCNGTFTVTLPPAARCINKLITIKNTGTGVITIDGDGAETIDGDISINLSYKNDALDVVSDGTNWNIIRAYTAKSNYSEIAIPNISLSGTVGATAFASLQISSTGKWIELGLLSNWTVGSFGRLGILRDDTFTGNPSPSLRLGLYRDGVQINDAWLQSLSRIFGGSTLTGIGFEIPPSVLRWIDNSVSAGTHSYTAYWSTNTTVSRANILDCKFFAREL